MKKRSAPPASRPRPRPAPARPTPPPDAPGGPLALVATCALGLEEILAGELRELGIPSPLVERGAVTFRGSWGEVWRTNLWLRTANRVLVTLASWEGATGDQLAAGAQALVEGASAAGGRELAWGGLAAGPLFAPDRTLAITASSSRSSQRDVRWIALKVKDGLVDGQRRRHGRRASVDRQDPGLPLRVRLYEDRATLFLDTSGLSLDHRGYRVETGQAPVREQIAAACVLAASWRRASPGERRLVADPMCGSGTLLAEAAGIVLGRPPGVARTTWAFQSLPHFDPKAFEALKGKGPARGGPEIERQIELQIELHGADRDPAAVRAARTNLEAAGLADRSRVVEADAFTWEPPEKDADTLGLVLINPPWGERLEAGESTEEARAHWRSLGDLLKDRYRGWTAVVLAGDSRRGKDIGLRPRQRIPVQNGPVDARILIFDLY